MSKPRRLSANRLAAVVAAVALLGAACGDSEPQQALVDTAPAAEATALQQEADTTTTTTQPCGEGESALWAGNGYRCVTSTATHASVEASGEPVAGPLSRCAQAGWPGSGRVSVLTGNASDGFYEPVVTGGDDSCEQIKAWWVEVTAAEGQRIAGGDYPCEYPAAYNYWPIDKHTNGPALLTGCWPRLLNFDAESRLPDAEAEAARLIVEEAYALMPPNLPVLVEAVWGCYRQALEGPPPGWAESDTSWWPKITHCNTGLWGTGLGDAVRYLGVTPQCAAEQYSARVEERKQHGYVGGGADLGYQGDATWGNCDTHADRLLPAALTDAGFPRRCEAVIDASVDDRTTTTADSHGLTRAEYVAEVKAMYCHGSRDHLRGYPHLQGEWVAAALPPQPAVCFHDALLQAAHRATTGLWAMVVYC